MAANLVVYIITISTIIADHGRVRVSARKA